MASVSKGLSQLQPVDGSSLHERVYLQLRQGIMRGKFRPGEILTLRGLAAALGTSIMPARDAVLRLCGERALEQSARGVRIPELDQQRFDDVTRFRIALEGEACALAAERASATEITAIEKAHERANKACVNGNLEKFLTANQEFHFTVYRAAHNPLLQSMIETLWLQIGAYLARMAESANEGDCSSIDLSAHQRLVVAIKKRNSEAAKAALRSDLSDRDDLFEALSARRPASGKSRAHSG
jgi:DNA-binding GntR family transcriptional regulator